jgi:hypothetical protein
MHCDHTGQEGEPAGIEACPTRLQHRVGPCILPGEIRTQGISRSSMEGVLEDHNHGDPHRRLDSTGRVVALGEGFHAGHLLLHRVPNTGLSANTTGRVNWPGVKKNITCAQVLEFTAGRFFLGDEWIREAQVPYTGGMITS